MFQYLQKYWSILVIFWLRSVIKQRQLISVILIKLLRQPLPYLSPTSIKTTSLDFHCFQFSNPQYLHLNSFLFVTVWNKQKLLYYFKLSNSLVSNQLNQSTVLKIPTGNKTSWRCRDDISLYVPATLQLRLNVTLCGRL